MICEGRAAGGILNDYRLVLCIKLRISRRHCLTHTNLGAKLGGEITVAGLKLIDVEVGIDCGNVAKCTHGKTVGKNIYVNIRLFIILTEIINKCLSTCTRLTCKDDKMNLVVLGRKLTVIGVVSVVRILVLTGCKGQN